MKQRLELTVEARETGKANSRAHRDQKQVPGVIYGAGTNANVYVHENDVLKYNTRQFENALFNLKSPLGDANGRVVLMKTVD
ncbi:MAG: 50S ribosomal protein L25, partial [Bdellovibrionota bacterium]